MMLIRKPPVRLDLTYEPDSIEALMELIEESNKLRRQLKVGRYSKAPSTLCLDKLNQIKAHRPEEFMITLGTGVTMGEIHNLLKPHGQRLALRYAPQTLLSDVLGHQLLSLSQTRYNPLPYWVLGTEVITGDGVPIHYGGEVVKNVTGYDMNKLFVGSHHTFGIITSTTLRLDPAPEREACCLLHCETLGEALGVINQVSSFQRGIEMCTLFQTKQTFGWKVLLVFTGEEARVESFKDSILKWTAKLNQELQVFGLEEAALDDWLTQLDWACPSNDDGWVCSVVLPQQQLIDFVQKTSLAQADLLLPWGVNQCVLRWKSSHQLDEKELLRIKEHVIQLGGHVEVQRVPQTSEYLLSEWNTFNNPVLQRWYAELKKAFDPNSVLASSLYPVEVTM